ncbi:hypothetical protein PSP6_750010 [Paraburkholderia tropica]|nr:hypothetical protein PSP6_750010 [Paraburkholderia tropica]
MWASHGQASPSDFGVVQHHLSFALVGAGVFCVALLSMVNDRFRGFLIRAAEQEKRAAR